jgi:hypothetical protein
VSGKHKNQKQAITGETMKVKTNLKSGSVNWGGGKGGGGG